MLTLTALEKLYNGLSEGTFGTDDIISQLVGDPDAIPACAYCDNEYIDRTVLTMLNNHCSIDRCVAFIGYVNPHCHWHYRSGISNDDYQIDDRVLSLSLMYDLDVLIKEAKRAEANCATAPTPSFIKGFN